MRIREDEYTLETAEEIESEIEDHIEQTFEHLENSEEARKLYEFVEEKRGDIDHMVDELRGMITDITNVFERTNELEEKVQDKYYEMLEEEPKFNVGDMVYVLNISSVFTVIDFISIEDTMDEEEHLYMLRSNNDSPYWMSEKESDLSHA